MDARRQAAIKWGLTAAGVILFLRIHAHLKPAPDEWMLRTTNNPDRFFAWTTNGSSYQRTFTYDPHAADDWLREFAGGACGSTNALR